MSVSLVDFVANPQICDVKTLDVIFWSSERWDGNHSIALMNICNDLKVEKLFFWIDPPSTRASDKFYAALKSYGEGRMMPNLPHLHEIHIALNSDIYPVLWFEMFRCARIRKMSWKVVCYSNQRDRFDTILCNLMLDNNFYLRELYFSTKDRPFVLFNQNSSFDFNLTRRGSQVSDRLARNCRAFEKCQNAIIVLLGLVKQKAVRSLKLAGPDIMKIVINMTWETRETAIWV